MAKWPYPCKIAYNDLNPGPSWSSSPLSDFFFLQIELSVPETRHALVPNSQSLLVFLVPPGLAAELPFRNEQEVPSLACQQGGERLGAGTKAPRPVVELTDVFSRGFYRSIFEHLHLHELANSNCEDLQDLFIRPFLFLSLNKYLLFNAYLF